jgi:hypothetical protein
MGGSDVRDDKFVNNISVGKSEGNIPLGRPRCTWENIIKIDLKETQRDAVDWIHLAKNGGPVVDSCELTNSMEQSPS